MRILEGELHTHLRQIALDRAPLEAVGLILPDDDIIELPNRSDEPEDQFVASRNDIIEALSDIKGIDLENVVLFHTHPGGGVGPSKIDMRNKTPFQYHLVVTVVDGDVVYSWY